MSTDADLLHAWRQGDPDAGRVLFSRHFAGVHRFFANKASHGVDDLVQETFLACVQGKDRLREGGTFRGFIYSVARRRLYRKWRNESHGAGAIDFGLTSIADLLPSPSTLLRARESQKVVLEALRQLPVEMQVALELYYWEGLRAAELATALDVPEGTVRSRLRRGRERLHALIAVEEGDAASIEDRIRSMRSVVSPSNPA